MQERWTDKGKSWPEAGDLMFPPLSKPCRCVNKHRQRLEETRQDTGLPARHVVQYQFGFCAASGTLVCCGVDGGSGDATLSLSIVDCGSHGSSLINFASHCCCCCCSCWFPANGGICPVALVFVLAVLAAVVVVVVVVVLVVVVVAVVVVVVVVVAAVVVVVLVLVLALVLVVLALVLAIILAIVLAIVLAVVIAVVIVVRVVGGSGRGGLWRSVVVYGGLWWSVVAVVVGAGGCWWCWSCCCSSGVTLLLSSCLFFVCCHLSDKVLF